MIRLLKCKGTINIQVLNVIAFCVSQNNFISGTYVDSVDEYVFALCSNGIFILHYLSLERIVCYSIHLVSLGCVISPKNELYNELS